MCIVYVYTDAASGHLWNQHIEVTTNLPSPHYLPLLPPLTPSLHSLPSLPSFTPSPHSLPSLPPLTPSPHPLPSPPPLTPFLHSLPSPPPFTPSPHPLPSLPSFTPSPHPLPSLPPLTPSPHSLPSLPPPLHSLTLKDKVAVWLDEEEATWTHASDDVQHPLSLLQVAGATRHLLGQRHGNES